MTRLILSTAERESLNGFAPRTNKPSSLATSRSSSNLSARSPTAAPVAAAFVGSALGPDGGLGFTLGQVGVELPDRLDPLWVTITTIMLPVRVTIVPRQEFSG